MNSMTKVRKGGIALMVGALALSGAVGATAVANAVEVGPAVPAQHIDTAKSGQPGTGITIHKFANPSSGTNGNGLELTDVTNPVKPTTAPVPGVTFTYQKLDGINLTTNEGWVKASKLTINDEGDVTGATVSSTVNSFQPTDAQGEASVDSLDFGVYLIKETDTPNSVVAKAKPFLVTVPFPNNDAKTKAATPWLYKVHVYPKNTVLTDDERPKKDVNDEAAIHFPGDKISWTITQKIPQLETGKALESYVFTDVLPDTVNPINDVQKIVVTVANADGDAVTVNPTKTAGQTVKVEFTGEELKKLTAGATVTITLETTIADAPTGSIVNQSITNVNGKNFHSIPDGVTITPNNDPDIDGNNPDDTATKVIFADLKISKKNSDNQPLKGAEFKVALAATDNTCNGVTPKTATDNVYKNVLTSNDAGEASLKVKEGFYCVQETKAPLGYVLDETVHPVQVTADGTVVGAEKVLKIENLKYNEGGSLLPSLPVTGALGFVLLVLAGVMIIALAVGTGFVAVGRNKKRAK